MVQFNDPKARSTGRTHKVAQEMMMGTAKGAGRTIGVLLLVQIAAGVLVNLVLLGPVITVPPGFLVNAATHSLQVSLSVLVGLGAGALSVAIAIAAMPVFRQHSHAMAARNWAHYINLIVTGGMIFVLYSTRYRFALVPRVLAAFGLGAVMLQLAAVTMPLFGHPVVFLMLLPLGLSHLALSLWLIVKGFEERRPSAAAIRE